MRQSRFTEHDDPEPDGRDAVFVHEEGEQPVDPWMRERNAERTIDIYQDHKALVYRTLNLIKANVGTPYLTRALELCCANYLSCDEAAQNDVTVSAAMSSRTRIFHYCAYPEQEAVIEGALDEAQLTIRLADRGAALAHICAVFELTYMQDLGAGE